MTKQIANIEQIQTNVSVGMDDLVNVFISKYETSLIDQRNTLQDQLKVLNKTIVGLGETAIKDAKETVKCFHLDENDFKNGYISVKTEVKDEFKLDWENKRVSFVVQTKLVSSIRLDWRTEGTTEVTSAVGLAPDLISGYDHAIEEKRVVMEELTKINNELRDISRKERQVRGKIAERKFVASGLEDLLADQELAKLIQL